MRYALLICLVACTESKANAPAPPAIPVAPGEQVPPPGSFKSPTGGTKLPNGHVVPEGTTITPPVTVDAPIYKGLTTEELQQMDDLNVEINKLNANLVSELKAWEKQNKTVRTARSAIETRRALVEQIARLRTLNPKCCVVMLDEEGKKKCGTALWGYKPDGTIETQK